MEQIRKLKKELMLSIVACAIAAVALTSATYAWFVANNKVTAETSKISATTNGFILQIASMDEGVQHGGEQQSLTAYTTGATLSPASTDNLKDWYICQGWNENGLITSYRRPSFLNVSDTVKPGIYSEAGKDYHAYIRSDYIVYTITQTGTADVYLADDGEGNPITVTTNGDNTEGAKTVTDSMRVAITTQPLGADGKTPTGEETLRVVYAVNDETGRGNDSTAIDGWTSIRNDNGTAKLDTVTYPYIYGGHYTDQLDTNRNWVATKNGDNFTVPKGSAPIAAGVGYDGIVIHVYIWMEGTDADCVNGKSIEDDPTTYDVTVKLAGVAANATK